MKIHTMAVQIMMRFVVRTSSHLAISSLPFQISLVGYTSSGKQIEYDELLVFHKDAVKPLYIVVHD